MGEEKSRRNGRALTAASVLAEKRPGKHHDGRGLGLYLRVEPNGARFWVRRITIRGKRRELGLGSPPTVTLAKARDKATDNKRVAIAGGDPCKPCLGIDVVQLAGFHECVGDGGRLSAAG